MIYPETLCEYLRAAVRSGRLEGWKPLGHNRWVLNVRGERCRDDWTDDEVIRFLAEVE